MPFFDRLCVKEYIIPGTTVAIEKGLKVMIPMLGLNYDPQHFPNPTLYDPERFSEQTEDSRHPFVFMPFGDGPRNCIGKNACPYKNKPIYEYIVTFRC